jgi:predicted ABC-type ATPase
VTAEYAQRPQLWIVAGPNGAGKTTLTSKHFAGRVPVVNPDDIANRINPNHQGSRATMLRAGRIAIAEQQALLAKGKSFVVETTLTGKRELKLIQHASALGYKVNLLFVGVHDVQLSASRVAQRVAVGGHAVPAEDIFRRFSVSLAHLGEALPLVDRALVLDNSGLKRQLLLSVENGQLKYGSRNLPEWAKSAIPAALQKEASQRRAMRI